MRSFFNQIVVFRNFTQFGTRMWICISLDRLHDFVTLKDEFCLKHVSLLSHICSYPLFFLNSVSLHSLLYDYITLSCLLFVQSFLIGWCV